MERMDRSAARATLNLKTWATLLNIQDVEGNTPLHVAAMGGFQDVCEFLTAAGVASDVRNEEGSSVADIQDAGALLRTETLHEFLQDRQNTCCVCGVGEPWPNATDCFAVTFC